MEVAEEAAERAEEERRRERKKEGKKRKSEAVVEEGERFCLFFCLICSIRQLIIMGCDLVGTDDAMDIDDDEVIAAPIAKKRVAAYDSDEDD